MSFNKEPDYLKFNKYMVWLAQRLPNMSPADIKKHKKTLDRGISRMNQLALSYGEEFTPPDINKVFDIAKKNASKITWVNPKIEGYDKIGLWYGANHKTNEGIFVFNIYWFKKFAEDRDDGKFNLKAYMDLDCEKVN